MTYSKQRRRALPRHSGGNNKAEQHDNGELARHRAALSEYSETDGGRLRVAINEAGPGLICLLRKLMSDLAFAPKLPPQNVGGREAREEGIKTVNPFSQGHFWTDMF